MKLKIVPVDRMIAKCQMINSLMKRLAKLKASLDDPDLPSATRRRRFASILSCEESLALQYHELHCEAVQMGIADPMSSRYGMKTLEASFGITHIFHRDPNENPILTADPNPGTKTPLEEAIAREKTQPETTNEGSIPGRIKDGGQPGTQVETIVNENQIPENREHLREMNSEDEFPDGILPTPVFP